MRPHGGKALLLGISLVWMICFAPVAPAQNGVWTQAAPMLMPHSAGSTAVVDGELYLAGTGSANPTEGTDVEVYDPTNNTWTTLANFPTPYVAYALGAGVGEKFYVIGGCQSTPFTGPDCALTTGNMEIYDVTTDTWSSGPAMPIARNGVMGGVINGKIYVAGGQVGSTPLNVLEVYDPVAGTWTTLSPMPTARRQSASAVINGKLYVAGGYNQTTGTFLATLEIYDPSTDTWSTGASLPAALGASMGSGANGYFYVIGGTNSSTLVNTVYAYNPGADSWTPVASVPLSGGIFLAGVQEINGVIYVAGGQTLVNGSAPYLASVEAFTPSTTGGFAQLTGGNTFTGNQTVNGSVSATSFTGNGAGLTNVNAATAAVANGLNCMGCVGNTQLGVNYAQGDAQGGNAVNALALGGNPASFFAPLSGDPNYAPASGSGNYVAKAGDTMTGALKLPANGLVAGGSQFVLSGGRVGIGTASPDSNVTIVGDNPYNPNGSSNSSAQLRLHNTDSSNGTFMTLTAASGSNTPWGVYRYGSNGATTGVVTGNPVGNQANRFCLGVLGANEPFCVSPQGTVGISTAFGPGPYPLALEVNGTAKFDGLVTFAAGQTFPGAGTITGVTAGTGLLGGGTTGNVPLSVNQSVVAFQSDLASGVNTAETFATNAANTAQTNAISQSESYANGAFVPLTGGTMTGALNLPANGLAAGRNQLVLSGGLVGIGSSAPVAKLDVEGGGAIINDGGSVPANPNATLFLGLRPDGYNSTLALQASQSEGGVIDYDTAGHGKAGFHFVTSGQSSPQLTIVPSGSVGIGTGFSTPQATLEVNGTAQFDGTVTFVPGQSFTGNGAGLTNVTATNLTGTINDSQVNNLSTDLTNATTSAVRTSETYANSTFVPLAGGTMTGTLNAPAVNVSGNTTTTGSTATGTLTIGSGGTPITSHVSVLFQNQVFNTKLQPATCRVWSSPSGAIPSAADGDTVAAGLGSSLMSLDIVYSAWAVDGGVDVRICNPTGKPVALGSGNIRVDVWKQ